MKSSVSEKRKTGRPAYLLDQLRWRSTLKRFDPERKIPADVWSVLEEGLVFTPSSFGLQPWKFIVVKDPDLRKRLRLASMGQPQVTDASHLVVFAHKQDLKAGGVERFVRQVAEVRGVSRDSLEGYKKVMATFVDRAGRDLDINVWSAHQLYIALGNFLASAAMLKVDACPMENVDARLYDKILGLDREGHHTVFVAAAGYRADGNSSARSGKARLKMSEVVERR